MADEKVTVTGTTKTDDRELAARQKWQRDMVAEVGEQTFAQTMTADTMKSMMEGMQSGESLAQQTQMTSLLTTVQSNTFKTANLLEGYIDFMKDVERKKLEAAMEAARQKDKKDKGGGSPGDTEKLKEMDISLGGMAAGLVGALGAGLFAFKDKWSTMFTGFGKDLDEMGKPKIGFFSKLKI